MAHIKTAISIQKDLLERADSLARELNISRSRLVVLAIEELLERHENERLLKKINEAFSDAPDPAETLYLQKARRQYRRMVIETGEIG
jgi:metal-responsive CopG/Arc/MetJ family transcriptional regulator